MSERIRLDARLDVPDGERYAPLSVLGRGGMGEVRLCRDRRTGRSIARKTALAKRDPDFVREALVQGQLEHPSIVPVYDVGIDAEGACWFTMKRIAGKSLAQAIDAVRSQAPDAVVYTRHKLLTAVASVCLAVDFAHRRGVVHGDLKPANVMLGEWGEVYLLDWGLAAVADEAKAPHDGSIRGTPGFLAPEQIAGAGATVASDVYALGAIVYAVLALENLNDGEGVEGRLLATMNEAEARIGPRFVELDLAPELAAIAIRATRSSPSERYPSARDLHDAIEGFLEGDRALELRRKLADEHSAAARVLAKADRGRRDAIREVGRALALDPENREAFGVLVELLERPPEETPREVEEEVRRSLLEAEKGDLARSRAPIVGLAIFGAAALVLGVQSLVPFVLQAAAIVTLLVLGRSGRADRFRMIAFGLLMTAVATQIGLFGSLVLVPTIVTGMSVPLSQHATPAQRRWVIVPGSLLIVALPVALAELGVLPRTYVIEAGRIVILPHLTAFPASWTLLVLTVLSVLSVHVAIDLTGRLADSVRAAKRTEALRHWHFRQLVAEPAAPSLPDERDIADAKCPDEETLLAYAERRLTGRSAARIVRHIDACDACRQVVSLLAQSDEADTLATEAKTIVDDTVRDPARSEA